MASVAAVGANRGYGVCTAQDARRVARSAIGSWGLSRLVAFGLPEIDDRYDVWRVPVLCPERDSRVGEVVIDAHSGAVQEHRTTTAAVIGARLARAAGAVPSPPGRPGPVVRSALADTVVCGDAETALAELPEGAIDLVFTSPPYFNARPDYTDYVDYEDYLAKVRAVIRQCHRVLAEGRFFVMNVAPVLLRRAKRSQASRRIAVPFDMHRLFTEEGFDFIDDIVWCKPEGAGWATGRGRRFAADRNPLQYKAVPVTEYVLVYRKHTDRLIDWSIRHHHDPEAVERSKIGDDYERTNVWRIAPASDGEHPAVFPRELAERVISYYSFEDDVVLDPFAGVGTTAQAARALNRRYVMIELEPRYADVMRARLQS